MTTKETIESDFAALKSGEGWERHLAEDMEFIRHTAPVKEVAGRDAYLESTQGFYQMIDTVEIRHVMADGDRACALTQYRLRPPVGEPFTSDVAEFFTVRDHKIQTFSIYFDTAPYPV